MIKSILVPMGDSECSRNALEAAVNLANLLKATIRLLYVEDTTKMIRVVMTYRMAGGNISLDLPGLDLQDKEIKRIEEEIEKEKEQVQKYYDEVKDKIEGEHSLIIKRGDVAREILETSKSTDFIVMGKVLEKDITGLQSAIFNVIQHANRPMIALCKGENLGRNILIAYDGSRSSNNALRAIGDFIPFISPEKITILTVSNSEEKAKLLLEEGEAYFLPYKIPVEKIWKDGKECDTIIKTANEKKSTLIVIGGYGDNKFKEFLLGSTTEKVLRGIDIPVMVCNA